MTSIVGVAHHRRRASSALDIIGVGAVQDFG
jgi:hypothetical protein